VARATALFHATLPVDDLARAEAFYRDFLGIQRHATPSPFPETVVFLDLGNTMIHLVRRRADVPPIPPRSTHLAIEVDDLDALFAAAPRYGATGLSAAIETRPDFRCFFFLDPDQNRIELTQHSRGSEERTKEE
jgi:catechol 2,3-dioxygenase-like lactoylglutathione lyase family enzyme